MSGSRSREPDSEKNTSETVFLYMLYRHTVFGYSCSIGWRVGAAKRVRRAGCNSFSSGLIAWPGCRHSLSRGSRQSKRCSVSLDLILRPSSGRHSGVARRASGKGVLAPDPGAPPGMPSLGGVIWFFPYLDLFPRSDESPHCPSRYGCVLRIGRTVALP